MACCTSPRSPRSASNKVEDYVKEGQVVRVKVLETDDRGRVKLSMKAAAAEEGTGQPAAAPQAAAQPEQQP